MEVGGVYGKMVSGLIQEKSHALYVIEEILGLKYLTSSAANLL